MIKKFINKKSIFNIILFAVYCLFLAFLMEYLFRGNWENVSDFLHHFFKAFLYNALIISVTLSPCFLFKRRLFAFSLASLIWIILGIANNFLIKFRETPLTFADLRMIKSGIELSEQYLSKNSIMLIASLFIVLIIVLSFIFFKCKKVKVKYIINIPLIFIYFLVFSKLINYGLENNFISKNFWDVNWGYNTYGFSYSFYNSAVNTGISKPNNYSDRKSVV